MKGKKTKMAYLGITENTQKQAYDKSQASAELLTFCEKKMRDG